MLREAQRSGDYRQFAEYVAGNYDSSQDFWKLLKDGRLIDDGRNSLYLETPSGGEFRIWEMEGRSRQESLASILFGSSAKRTESQNEEATNLLSTFEQAKQIFGEEFTGIIADSLSKETIKRLNLFSITAAASYLTEENFERVAQNSFYGGDKLGYFIDFDLLTEAMKFRGPFLSRADSVMRLPDDVAVFNKDSFLRIAGIYSQVAGPIGMQMRFDDPLRTIPFNDVKMQSSTGGLPYGSELIQKLYDEQKSQPTGIPVVGYYQNGRIRFGEQGPLAIGFFREAGSSVTALVSGGAMVAQFLSGTSTGFDMTNTRVPLWSAGGMDFFTVYSPQLRSIERNGVSVFGPKIPWCE